MRTKRAIFITLITILFFQTSFSQEIEYELLQHYTIDDIEDVFVEYGIPPFLISIEHEVDYYKVTYPTIHPNGDSIIVSGGMCVPSGMVCPMPMASYQHGTIAEQLDVPSQMNYEGSIGIILSSNGYLSVMPDYIGLGESDYFHLYLHAESEANACLDMLRAARELQNELEYNLDEQLFLFGYSQGGHATMALQKKIEEEYPDEFTISACAPMSGPYNISGVQADFLLDSDSYPSSGYLPYIVLSYQEVYGNIFNSMSDIFIEPYAGYIQDFLDESISLGTLNNLLPNAPADMVQPDYLEDMNTNENNTLLLAMQDNDLYDWTPESVTNLFYCSGDDVVTYLNSELAIETFEANGSTSVTSTDGGNLGHGACAPFAILSGYNFFEDNREAGFAPEVEIVIENVSAVDAEDGSFQVLLTDTTGLEFLWTNGMEGLFIENLSFGYYELTITNEFGCEYSVSGVVGISVGVEEIANQDKLSIYPNPVSSNVIVETTLEHLEINIYNSIGDIVLNQKLNKGKNSIPVENLQPGIYYIKSIGDNRLSVALMKL